MRKHTDTDLEEAVEYITALIQVKTRYALGSLGSLSEAWSAEAPKSLKFAPKCSKFNSI